MTSFGLSLPNRGVLFGAISTEELLEMSALADRSGVFDSVWVGDSLLAKPRLEAVVTLTAIAMRTARVKLGTACLASFPYRDPFLLAIQWASLDVISGGRSLLCVCMGASGGWGMGDSAREVRALRFNPKERVGRFEEGIEVIRRLWNEESATFHGRFFDFEDVSLAPKPVQRPCPIWIANNPDKAKPEIERLQYGRVATLADGWLTARYPTPDELARRLRGLAQALAAAGRDIKNLPVSYHMMININESSEAAWEQGVKFLTKYYGSLDESNLRIWLVAGSPQEVARRIQAYIDVGLTVPILRFAAWDGLHQLRRFIDEVNPLIVRR